MKQTETANRSSPTYAEDLVRHLFGGDAETATELFFTTNPGLEDVVAEEFHRRTRAAGLEGAALEIAPFGLGGHVLARIPHPFAALEPLVYQMRSIHHVLRPLYAVALPAEDPLNAIRAELRELEIPEMRVAASFRVTTRRLGQHAFTSMDVQREAGAALVERYACPVDLENYALNVRVDVYDERCIIGLQLTHQALSKRYIRQFQPRAALKTPVAFAMLQFAGLEETSQGALLDPFCGSGTILIEAAQLFPHLEIHGSDLFPEPVAGARLNAASLSLDHRIRIRQADARALVDEFPLGHFRAIVTNPPYGIVFGRKLDFFRFYSRFLEQAWKMLAPGGFLVLLAWKRGVFTRALRQFGQFVQRHVRVVETGDLYPRLFVLEKPATAAAEKDRGT